MNNKIKNFFKSIFDYFFQGFLYIAPIGLTIYVTYLIFIFIDNIAQQVIEKVLKFHIPGLGILLMFILITLIGILGHKLVSHPIKLLLDKTFTKTPFIQTVYTSIRDLISAFVGKDKKFTQPVLVKLSKIYEIEKIGFLTESDLSDLGLKDKVAVYFPYSYAFMGELLIVPTECVTPLDINPAEAMKFIVSGGVTKIENSNENETTINKNE